MRRRGGRSATSSKKTDPNIGRVIEVAIDAIGSSGDGIGRFEDAPVYVPLALPGDALSVRLSDRRGAGYAAEMVESRTLMRRHQPICAHFGACGGCRLQHLRPLDYRAWKGEQVQTALASRGIKEVDIKPLIDGEPATRRRLRLAFKSKGHHLALGFRRRLGSDIVAIEACPIALPSIVNLLNPLQKCLESIQLSTRGGEISITACDNGLDVLIETKIEPNLADREALAAFAEAEDPARLAWRYDIGSPVEPIAVRRQPMIDVDDIPVALPLGAFLQATKEAESAIRRAVAKALDGSAVIADLFAGCGALSLPLIKEGLRVLAVERDPLMVQALSAAAAGRVDTIARDLDREPLTARELQRFDGLIIDPPRAGARAQIEAVAEGQGPRALAMVSCNPATFARDARILIDAGYRLNWVQPIDAFLFSAEIELVAAFERAITP
ncbi:MAG: TRAM domain-containing protein [Pseudomonadota bacterium]